MGYSTLPVPPSEEGKHSNLTCIGRRYGMVFLYYEQLQAERYAQPPNIRPEEVPLVAFRIIGAPTNAW